MKHIEHNLFTVPTVMGNASGPKKTQLSAGQAGVSISRSFLSEKPWSFRHP